MILGGVDDEALKAMDHLVEHEGITSFKLFMAYPGVFYSDDGQILRAMQKARDNGAMIMMHAENGIAIDVLVAQALERGETDPVYHGLTRPSELEAEATNRAIALAGVAGDCPLYIVHLSAAEALAQVAEARRHRAGNVFAETCPQYLYLTLEDQLGAPGFEGAKWVCLAAAAQQARAAPRRPVDRACARNDLAVVSTDHCPFCMKDQKELGIGDFSQDPERDRQRRAPAWTCSTRVWSTASSRWPAGWRPLDHAGPDVRPLPAQGRHRTGLGRRHRALRPGRAHARISVETHHMNMDYSAYEGFEIAGKVDTVLSRGSVVIAGGEYHGRKGHGQFLRRGLSELLN